MNVNLQETVGRRKTAVARVFLRNGNGKITVNKKSIEDYFFLKKDVVLALEPLTLLNMKNNFDILITVKGGGLSSQADAIKLGIARALLIQEPSSKMVLKENKFLTRDSRKVERKKYGRAGARKKFQFSKR